MSTTDRPELTPRETQVLALVVARYRNPEIAASLSISKRTVESHIAALLRKFAVADRAGLITAAASSTTLRPNTDTASNESPFPPEAGRPIRLRPAAVVGLARRRRVVHARRLASAAARMRNAIRVHQTVAERLDQQAAQWHERAATTLDAAAQAAAQARAAACTKDADAARYRVATSRRLLDHVTERLDRL